MDDALSRVNTRDLEDDTVQLSIACLTTQFGEDEQGTETELSIFLDEEGELSLLIGRDEPTSRVYKVQKKDYFRIIKERFLREQVADRYFASVLHLFGQ